MSSDITVAFLGYDSVRSHELPGFIWRDINAGSTDKRFLTDNVNEKFTKNVTEIFTSFVNQICPVTPSTHPSCDMIYP